MTNRRTLILAGVMALAAALSSCGGSSGDGVEVGVYSQELLQTLRSDPRFENSFASSGAADDPNSETAEKVVVIMPDENCPGPTYEACKEVVLDVVRLMLTTPHIDHFVGIEVTLKSFLPHFNQETGRTTAGDPPLAEKSLEEWRAIVGQSK